MHTQYFRYYCLASLSGHIKFFLPLSNFNNTCTYVRTSQLSTCTCNILDYINHTSVTMQIIAQTCTYMYMYVI